MYGCNSSGIFTTNVPVVVTALRNNFGLASANYVSGYDNARCISNLNNNWPVLLGGVDPNNSGHEWVCDGYQTAVSYCGSTAFNLLHMNWGWHEVNGSNDFIGWYAANNWSVAGYTFSNYQSMIAEIHQ